MELILPAHRVHLRLASLQVTMQPGPAPSSIAYSNARAAPSKQRPSSSTGTRSRATPAREWSSSLLLTGSFPN